MVFITSCTSFLLGLNRLQLWKQLLECDSHDKSLDLQFWMFSSSSELVVFTGNHGDGVVIIPTVMSRRNPDLRPVKT